MEDLGSGTRKIRMYAPLYSNDSKIEIKVDEILTMINTSRRTLYRILADLRKDGFVENIGNKNHPKWNVYNG